MPVLSALILSYNEGPSIGKVVAQALASMREFDPEAELVVVDGGSKDDTQEAARRAGAVVVQQRAKGYGNAFREGLWQVRGQYVITLDADGSHDPQIIRQLWSWRDRADIVVASRYVPGGSARQTLFRRGLSHFMNGTYRLILQLPLADLSSGYRMYRREVVDPELLESSDFDILVEVLVKVYHNGGRVREIPFQYAPRLHGESHLRVVRFGLSYGRTLLRLARLRHGRAAKVLVAGQQGDNPSSSEHP